MQSRMEQDSGTNVVDVFSSKSYKEKLLKWVFKETGRRERDTQRERENEFSCEERDDYEKKDSERDILFSAQDPIPSPISAGKSKPRRSLNQQVGI